MISIETHDDNPMKMKASKIGPLAYEVQEIPQEQSNSNFVFTPEIQPEQTHANFMSTQ